VTSYTHLDQPRLDGGVLVVEVAHVGHQILEHVHVRQGVDLGVFGWLVNVSKACQSVGAVDVHSARAANSLTAGTTESKRGILLVLDFQKSVEDHRTVKTIGASTHVS